MSVRGNRMVSLRAAVVATVVLGAGALVVDSPAEAAPTRPAVTLHATTGHVTVGESVRFTGRINPTGRRVLTLQRSTGHGWQTLVRIRTANTYWFAVRPTQSARYRVVAPRSGAKARLVSRVQHVRVTKPAA